MLSDPYILVSYFCDLINIKSHLFFSCSVLLVFSSLMESGNYNIFIFVTVRDIRLHTMVLKVLKAQKL